MRRVRDAVAERPATAVLVAALAGLLAGPHGLLPQAAGVLAVGAVARAPRLAAVLVAGLLAGAAIAGARGAVLAHTTLGPRLGHDLRASVVLSETPRATRFGWRATVTLGGERVLLEGRGAAPVLSAGRVLGVHGVLRGLRPREGWLRVRHVHAVLRARTVHDTGAARAGPAGALDRVRARAQHALTALLPAPEGALLRGMVLGDDATLAVDERDRLRRAGLGHLVAASGANIALLAALAAGLCAVAGVGRRTRLLTVLGLIAVYVPLAGAGPSIQRAGVMGAAAIAATLSARPAARWHALLLAAVVTLAADPGAVRDPAWQLSFAAVAAIALLGAPIARGLRDRGAPHVVAEGAALTLAATAGTAPVSAAAFGTVSLAGLLANVVVAPLVGPITWIGMLAALVAQVSPDAGALVAAPAGPPTALVLATGRWCAALPAAQVATGPLPVAVAVALVALAVLAPRARGPVATFAGALVLVAVLVGSARRERPVSPPAPGVLRVAFLDIGQGDATLVQSGTHAMLVDGGPPDGPVLRRLRDLGVRRLDLLVGTHAQADHLGGADRVVRALPTAAVLDGRDGVREAQGDELERAAAARGTPMVRAVAGQRLRIGSADVRVLWPPERRARTDAGADPNDRAVVLHVTGAGIRVLLAADAESGVLAGLGLARTDLVKVSHHGSVDAGLRPLLDRLRPRLAVIEVGRGNPYGHPAPQTLTDLRSAGVPALRTDRDGTVVVDARDGRLHVHARS